jgi:hypothetical protein
VYDRLAEYLEQEPERKKAAAEAQRAKLEALERKLGIDTDAGSSSNVDPTQVAGRKHRFDDTEYFEQSRDLVDNVKSAVTAGLPVFLFIAFGQLIVHSLRFAGLRKKRKKAKTDQNPSKSDAPSTPAQEQHLPSSVGDNTGTEKVSAVSIATVGA